MTELLTAAGIRSLEAAAIDSGEVTGLQLMERAGAGVVDAVLQEWPDLADAPHRAVVLCGPGNNGGDGYVVARLLQTRGWQVRLLALGNPGNLPPDAAENARRWRSLGTIAPLDRAGIAAANAWMSEPGAQDGVLVDAVFGTGLARPLSGELAQLLSMARSTGPLAFMRQVAVDVPSGLCSDSGRILADPIEGLAQTPARPI